MRECQLFLNIWLGTFDQWETTNNLWSADLETLNQWEDANPFWSADRETLNRWETSNHFFSADQGNFEPMRASQSFLIVKVSLLSTSTGPEIRKIPLPLLQKWQALILFIYFWDSVEPFTALLAGCKTYCARTWHNWGKENARNWSTGSKWGSRARSTFFQTTLAYHNYFFDSIFLIIAFKSMYLRRKPVKTVHESATADKSFKWVLNKSVFRIQILNPSRKYTNNLCYGSGSLILQESTQKIFVTDPDN